MIWFLNQINSIHCQVLISFSILSLNCEELGHYLFGKGISFFFVCQFCAGMEHWVQEAEQFFHHLEKWVRQQPVENLYVGLAVVVLTSALFVLCKSPRSSEFVV